MLLLGANVSSWLARRREWQSGAEVALPAE
jgi:hypothetical protein